MLEFSLTNPGGLESYFGFTEDEVSALCKCHHMSYDEARAWYNGYTFSQPAPHGLNSISTYSLKSIAEAMLHRCYQTYYNEN